MPKFDRSKFFTGIRQFLKSDGKTLTQKRTDALEFLIGRFEAVSWSIPWISYALATIAHETAWTFEPIKEYRNKPGTKGRANQDRYWLSGYYGRGYVQLTWKRNYELFGIASNPDMALEPQTAFRILAEGMRKGLFTGKKLSDYISDTGKDYRNACKVINGTDKASLIAGYALKFEDILRASKLSAATASQPTVSHNKAGIGSSDASTQQPPDFTEGERPTESKVTQEKGDTTVEISAKNEQDVNSPATVSAPEPYMGIGFWAVIKRDLAAATGGNLSLSGLAEYAQQASGWPEWVIGLIQKLAVGLLIATIGYFVFRVVHYTIDTWKKHQKTKLEAEAATSTVRKDITWQ